MKETGLGETSSRERWVRFYSFSPSLSFQAMRKPGSQWKIYKLGNMKSFSSRVAEKEN